MLELDNVDDLIKYLRNDLRENKNTWVFDELTYPNMSIKYKRYNTYYRIFNVNGVNLALPMEKTQKEILKMIEEQIRGII